MEHLALEILDINGKSQYAVLPEDASITITDTSEIFESGDLWSYSFSLNIRANAHIFGTAGEIHGSRLHEQVDGRQARLWVEGVALYLGHLRLDDEVDVDAEGNVDVRFESGQKTFAKLIEGAKANQVPLLENVLFGLALWRKRNVQCPVKLQATAIFKDGRTSGDGEVRDTLNPSLETITFLSDDETRPAQQYPRMVFPKGTFKKYNGPTTPVNCLNTDFPYDEGHPYCNITLCYQKHGYEKKREDGSTYNDYSGEPEAMRGYEVMPANRVNSAPNFYVIYWLRCLMKHLGIHIEDNEMMDIEDMRRLFFVNTRCAYKEPTGKYDDPQNIGWYQFTGDKRLLAERFDLESSINIEESAFVAEDLHISGPRYSGAVDPDKIPEIDRVVVHISGIEKDDGRYKQRNIIKNSILHDAYATSECFPDVDISEVIEALENGFGIRFLFSNDYRRVRIVLLRNIFRSDDVQPIQCDIISDLKKENNIRGFRMTYGNTDDTHFYYKGLADLLPHKEELWADNSDTHDYSKWSLDAVYGNLIHKVSAFDKTCYVTPDTGNAYGIKVDKNAKRYNELHPAVFEYAAFMDAEDGDCTGEEETIKTINVGFTPAIMNDLNMEQEREGKQEQQFALFVDEQMRPRRYDLGDLESPKSYNDSDAFYPVDDKLYAEEGGQYVYKEMMSGGIVKPGEFAIKSDMYARKSGLRTTISTVVDYVEMPGNHGVPIPVSAAWDIGMSIDGHINEGYRLYLQDNFEPNDDGVSPVETHDWGLMLGILRGSGNDAYVDYKTDPQDREGNDTWDIVPGSGAIVHSDTCDSYGHLWDYNGTGEGVGDLDGRISLKLRAEKPNPKFDRTKEETYYDPEHPELDTNPRYLRISNEDLRNRGLCDQFYKEYSYFVRNARIAILTVRMELAQLLSLDKTKRVTIGDITGFIKKMQYSVSNRTGLGLVTMEIMYI